MDFFLHCGVTGYEFRSPPSHTSLFFRGKNISDRAPTIPEKAGKKIRRRENRKSKEITDIPRQSRSLPEWRISLDGCEGRK